MKPDSGGDEKTKQGPDFSTRPEMYILLFLLFVFFPFGLLFPDRLALVYFYAVIAFLEGDPAREGPVAAFAVEIRAERLVPELPLFEPAGSRSADVAVKLHLLAVDVGTAQIGNKVVPEQHSVIELLAVRL